MKRNYFCLIGCIIILISCDSFNTKKISNKKVVQTENIETSRLDISQKQSMVQKIYHSTTIKRDTIVNNYHLSYIIRDNDEIITTYPITEGKGLDTVYYAGREVFLDIKYPNGEFLNKKINRSLFASYIPSKEIEKYSIYYFNYERVSKSNEIVFSISLCIPETDICYWFELYISNKNDIKIKNISSDEDDM